MPQALSYRAGTPETKKSLDKKLPHVRQETVVKTVGIDPVAIPAQDFLHTGNVGSCPGHRMLGGALMRHGKIK